ncbi:MAG: hypothetical protein N3D81_00150 [Spirochaetes bacterium]|nr:hypothetical protein [Spirochaetota bacterium]
MKKIIFSVLIVLLCSNFSFALFETPFVGGRYIALGLANVSEVTDPYAVIYNPAGLGYIGGIAISANYSEPFGVPGVNLINVNVAGNVVDIVQVGLTFSSYGADINATSGLRYLIAGVSIARAFELSDSVDFLDGISIGLSGKGLGLSLRGYELDESANTDKWNFNFDAGVNLSLFNELLKLGVVGYNLIPTKFSFLTGTQGTEIYSALKVGTSIYLIKPYMKAFGSYSLGLNSSSPSSFSVGTEVSYADTIFTRIGLENNRITMGLGLKGPGFELNFGVQNRDNLGWYYQADVIGFVDIF